MRDIDVRQVIRQIEMFLDDGVREHLIVALAILDSEEHISGVRDSGRQA